LLPSCSVVERADLFDPNGVIIPVHLAGERRVVVGAVDIDEDRLHGRRWLRWGRSDSLYGGLGATTCTGTAGTLGKRRRADRPAIITAAAVCVIWIGAA